MANTLTDARKHENNVYIGNGGHMPKDGNSRHATRRAWRVILRRFVLETHNQPGPTQQFDLGNIMMFQPNVESIDLQQAKLGLPL